MKPVSFFPILGVVLLLCLLAACSMEAPLPPTQSREPQGSWTIKATLPGKLSEVAVAAANGKIYVLGGTTPNGVDQRLNQEYDPATDRWRERAPLPRTINHAGATGLNGKIYVVGAFTEAGHGAAINSVFEYDPVTNAWRTLTPLKSPRGSVGVTVLDGKIHAIGGRGTDKVTVVTHEAYDPATGKWTELAPLPKARDRRPRGLPQ